MDFDASSVAAALARAAAGAPLDPGDALALAELPAHELPLLTAAAAARRDAAWGAVVTFSPKVFLPLTNLCRNRCDYCSFRRAPGEHGEWTMTPDDVAAQLVAARAASCGEALFCLGDKPEGAMSTYRRTLARFGHGSTVDYLVAAAAAALGHGLLPHTNAGVLDEGDMRRLRDVNASLGLMLESVSPRLCAPGMPHHRAPDKRPERRLRMLDEAGALAIPFTTGILIGIGETRRERVESLLAIRDLHRRHRHVQEVIVQPFRAPPTGVPMAGAPEPTDAELAHAVALARLILDDEVAVQAPPNLSPRGAALLLGAGVNDFGGISPVTPDYINRRHPWPQLAALARECAAAGFTLRPRLPIYPRFAARPDFVAPSLRAPLHAARLRLEAWPPLAPPAREPATASVMMDAPATSVMTDGRP